MSNPFEMMAMDVASNMVEDGEDKIVCFDPATIAVIVQVLALIAQNCFKDKDNPDEVTKDVHETAKRPGLFKRWALKRYIKESIDDDDMDRRYNKSVMEAVLKRGALVTADEVRAIAEREKELRVYGND